MAKKSFFEKIGFVESVEETTIAQKFGYDDSESANRQAYASPEIYSTEDFENSEDFLTVSEIYQHVGLDDLSHSIFKVDEFSKVLPDSLTTQVKRQSVVGILATSGLTVEELVADAEKRQSALQSALDSTSSKTNALIEEKQNEIAQLLAKVDELKQFINDRQVSQEKQEQIVKEEISKIAKITDFIAPAQQ